MVDVAIAADVPAYKDRVADLSAKTAHYEKAAADHDEAFRNLIARRDELDRREERLAAREDACGSRELELGVRAEQVARAEQELGRRSTLLDRQAQAVAPVVALAPELRRLVDALEGKA